MYVKGDVTINQQQFEPVDVFSTKVDETKEMNILLMKNLML